MTIKYLLGCALFALLTVVNISVSNAQQLTKSEKKALKKELKSMSPEELWQLKNSSQEQKVEIITLSKEVKTTREKAIEAEEDLKILQKKHEMLLESTTNPNPQMRTDSGSSEEIIADWKEGVIFRVQIGALTSEEYDKEIPGGFSMDVEGNGDLQRMLIGYYRDYHEADSFKKLMRKLGIRTAWIVPYKDGQRVALKEVLKNVVEE
ncbi:hypothetical protein GCM10007049_08550 [Echinicola pacifica]|uniref:Ezrin/radixin/moesin family protein n=1 Tax=Echinicola pacifica TaxID=346377 RepID=A0A918PPX4_9BACT|nr:SPOR domain-containing protein [Echinicola pacifica]GGZ18602.1 hypothetical protein GCM10007049_08550 [Echinicola pacifica]